MARTKSGQVAKRKAERLLALLDEIDRLDIKDLRQSVGLSLEKAARIADVSTRTFGRWENREAWPNSLEPLKRFCQYVVEAAGREVGHT